MWGTGVVGNSVGPPWTYKINLSIAGNNFYIDGIDKNGQITGSATIQTNHIEINVNDTITFDLSGISSLAFYDDDFNLVNSNSTSINNIQYFSIDTPGLYYYVYLYNNCFAIINVTSPTSTNSLIQYPNTNSEYFDLSLIQTIDTQTIDTSPSITIRSNKPGLIISSLSISGDYIGISGDNTITFNTLELGTYNGHTIRFVDSMPNDNDVTITIPDFTITTSQTSPSYNISRYS